MADTPATTPNVLPVPDHITLGHWQDQTNYECSLCPWASLDFDKAQEHSRMAHLPEGGNTEVIAGASTDRFGNEQAPQVAPLDDSPRPVDQPAAVAPKAAKSSAGAGDAAGDTAGADTAAGA